MAGSSSRKTLIQFETPNSCLGFSKTISTLYREHLRVLFSHYVGSIPGSVFCK